VAPERFVVFTANHDHVGNTPDGARPPYDHRQRLVAAATVLLSPFTPLLFMGEEYGETAPFPFFVDHSDPALLEATREGRRREFSGAGWSGDVADPADAATFESAVLDPAAGDQRVLDAYTELLALRRIHPVVHASEAEQTVARVDGAVVVRRSLDGVRSMLAVNLGDAAVELDVDPGLEIVYDRGDAQLVAGRLRLPGLTAVLLIS
jgi:maltooligosyltrehalose trehalohydrolase